MTQIDLYKQSGEKSGTIEVNDKIFNIEKIDHTLIHEALIRQESNARKPIAHTLTRAEVRGGGRKPRPQKGGGTSRQGSTRNIQWKGGGVAFGPRNNRNFTLLMPKKQRRKALFNVLTLKARDGEISALEAYNADKVSTKTFATMIEKLPFDNKILIIIPEKNKTFEFSGRNLPNVKIILAGNLNIKDLLSYKYILFLKDSFKKLEEIFLSKKIKNV